MSNRWNLPDLGIGVGLRTVHFPHILSARPDVDSGSGCAWTAGCDWTDGGAGGAVDG